jgi:hypothetical protein
MALRLVWDQPAPPFPDNALRTVGEPWWTHLAPPANPARERNPVGRQRWLEEEDLDPGKPMLRPAFFSPTNDAGER